MFAPILVSAIVCFAFGWLWHSSVLFGDRWMKEAGLKMPAKITPEVKKVMMRSMVLGFLNTLLVTFVLAQFMSSMYVGSAADAVQLAVWLWLGFSLPVSLSATIWEQKSLALLGINTVYNLISLILAGLVMNAMVQ